MAEGNLRTFTFAQEDEAGAKPTELYPALVRMEKYGDPRRARVIRIIKDALGNGQHS